MNQPFYILSIDGGGLKGLIAIKILQIIEEISRRSLVDKFSFLAGTSTGGLIVSALTTKKKNRSFHTLEDIEELYLQVAESIFEEGRFQLSGKELGKLNRIFNSMFGKKRISQSPVPLFIPSYDSTNDRNIFFNTREALTDKSRDPLLTDVCLATSAVPSVFPPHHLLYGGQRIRCVDAGLYHLKNPTLEALREVWEHRDWYRPGLDPSELVLLSISTGSFSAKRNNWTTDMQRVYPAATLRKALPDLSFSKIRFMRIDISMRSEGYSLGQIVDWMNVISGLSTSRSFRKDVEKLLL